MSSLTRTDAAWLRLVNIDVVERVAETTVLHPFIAWIIVLSVGALGYPLYSWPMLVATVYASALTAGALLSRLNRHVAFGASRQVNPAKEVVIVTGGANGLGRLIADLFSKSGANVAVLDVEDMQSEDTNVAADNISFYRCNVGNKDEINAVAGRIQKELGTPTVLVNNAGVMHGKRLLDLSHNEIESTISTNLLSNFYTLKQFLPSMIAQGNGTVVTVSSVIGHLGCAGLSDYAASKSGLLTLHASVAAELAQSSDPKARSIRMILCTPGQLNTRMFNLVRTPSTFFAPVIEPTKVAKEIVNLVNSGAGGEVSMPLYARWAPVMWALPASVQYLARKMSGMDQALSRSSETVSDTRPPVIAKVNKPIKVKYQSIYSREPDENKMPTLDSDEDDKE